MTDLDSTTVLAERRRHLGILTLNRPKALNALSLEMIRAITTLADALGMATLAEGVEDTAQHETLRREGCQTAQGYLFSEPVSADKIAGLLGENKQHLRQQAANENWP